MKNQIEMLIKAGENITDAPLTVETIGHVSIFMSIITIVFLCTGNLGNSCQVLLF